VNAQAANRVGVYYRTQDYVGVVRRVLIDLVDIPLAGAASALLTYAAGRAWSRLEDVPLVAFLVWGAVWFGYFVLLKRSRFRTLGYIATGARVVDLAGQRPSITRLVGRLLFAVVGPLNAVVDLFWLTGDPNRQALRDKFAGTYVVRVGVDAAGNGRFIRRTYMIWGLTFVFTEVDRGAP
jgi:uncharacterized RDD family membrane protein YckC